MSVEYVGLGCGQVHFQWHPSVLLPEALIQMNEWKNLSVSLALVERNKALLLWNLSAPCRLDAQVWPCAVSHHGCKEITGLRKRLPDGSWRQNNKGHWVRGTSQCLQGFYLSSVIYLAWISFWIIVVSSLGDTRSFWRLRPSVSMCDGKCLNAVHIYHVDSYGYALNTSLYMFKQVKVNRMEYELGPFCITNGESVRASRHT